MSETPPFDWERAQKERQVQAKARLLDLLRQHGIAQAEIEYDGYGDSGQVEHRCFFNQDNEEMTVKDPALSGAVDEYVCAILPLGWQDNAGGFGTVSIAVETQKVHVTHNDRFEDYTTREFDVEE